MKALLLFSSLLPVATLVSAAFDQSPLAINNDDYINNNALLNSVAQSQGTPLNSLSDDTFAIWAQLQKDHPELANNDWTFTSKAKPHKKRPHGWDFHVADTALPNHKLRARKHDPSLLGIDKVKQYTGYLDVEDDDNDKHFFYWFFESRNDPANDPVILWLNGGPGCSSLTGMFFELGPSSLDENLKPINNPYAWNNNASVIFLDQPVNVGFSYSSQDTITTAAAGKDVYAFLQLFFKQFSEYAHLPFHISGESYAGHYIPQFAAEILEHDAAERNFNLTSVLIGNGITDPYTQFQYYQPMACGKGGYPAVISKEECQAMLDNTPRCLELIGKCYQNQTPFNCVPPSVYCNNVAMGAFRQTGLNVYDVRKPCEGSLCYRDFGRVADYLNDNFVQETIGAEVTYYQSCNGDVGRNFHFAGDHMRPLHLKVIELLDEYDLPVLLYAGDKDFICNWLGNHAYSDLLPYKNHKSFAKEEFKNYVTENGEYAGLVKNYEKFTFLRIFDAGHMVPYDKPEASLDFVNRWVRGDYKLSD